METNYFNQAYVGCGGVFFIEDKTVNNGGLGVFFSFEGAKKYLKMFRKDFKNPFIRRVKTIEEVNPKMMSVREGYIGG